MLGDKFESLHFGLEKDTNPEDENENEEPTYPQLSNDMDRLLEAISIVCLRGSCLLDDIRQSSIISLPAEDLPITILPAEDLEDLKEISDFLRDPVAYLKK